MIVDSSAIVAIFLDEPECSQLRDRIVGAQDVRIPSPAYLETAMVCDSLPTVGVPGDLDLLLDMLQITIAPFTGEHARLARGAFARYGRGSGHPARLNFGDCMSYAVAVLEDEPLLFKGEDFTHTDVRDARTATG